MLCDLQNVSKVNKMVRKKKLKAEHKPDVEFAREKVFLDISNENCDISKKLQEVIFLV